ncbi:MAG: CoA transferase [Gammaproteobacteria bacterium]|jgi:crotonobetainyl-CoA:carnitine CoA-transferase CaiB-like acyl-CoA transferase|nr:CoA transferase [Gammaproteobacteria bacterium]|tara:strand:+ start:9206 stop:10402 length:1197 start_codon:yes stop_codon:yes gene_type:complete
MTRLQALHGVTVLDLGQIYNGPYATFLMAMAGARVIKVESLLGETLRGRGQLTTGTYAFAMLNQQKESITLDLKTAKGIALFKQLVEQADVVLENFGPDTMENLGLDSKTLLEINPRLIYAAGSGYGRSGEQRDYLAMDVTVQAMVGVMSTTGIEDMPPLKAGPAISDFFGGIHLYSAVVTALLQREQTGAGIVLDVAMQDSVLPTLASIIGAYYYHDKEVPARTGNKHAGLALAPYNVYPSLDGHVSIICIRNSHWRSLVAAIGRPELVQEKRYETMPQRAELMDEVDEIVSSWTSTRTKAEGLKALQEFGVPSAMVRDVEEVLADSHLHERGMLRDVKHGLLGDITLPNSPINIAFGDTGEPGMEPELGASNEAVYGEMLGLSADELLALQAEKII